MKENDRMTVDAGDYHTYITIKKVQRLDTGIYKVTAKNEHGVDAADVDVTVLSVPGKPMGPIWVTNVTANSCHLEWKPPKDDGGDPIKYYTVEKMDTEKGSILEANKGSTQEKSNLIKMNSHNYQATLNIPH